MCVCVCDGCVLDDANIWEEDREGETSIRYDKNGQVVGATLNKLVERVTSTRDHGELGEGREGRGGEGGEGRGEGRGGDPGQSVLSLLVTQE